MTKLFSKNLLNWHKTVKRALPWKKTRDAYKIWVSEIILQQTQVIQGIPYYKKFIKRFPNVKSLAVSELDEVLALWTGLGYYSRARNMHKAAKAIMERHHGKFPDTFEDILALPGVGEYTASAISSFAFNNPYAVVDANVIRVLARYYCLEQEVHQTEVLKDIKIRAFRLLDKKAPAEYNQAIMDFGALICKPKEPNCEDCVMENSCLGRKAGIAKELPRKKIKKPRRERFFHYMELCYKDKIMARQRTDNDIWNTLYELPYIETQSKRRLPLKRIETFLKEHIGPMEIAEFQKLELGYKQTLSHQYIHGVFYRLQIKGQMPPFKATYLHVSRKKLQKMAIPKIIDWYIRQKPITLR